MTSWSVTEDGLQGYFYPRGSKKPEHITITPVTRLGDYGHAAWEVSVEDGEVVLASRITMANIGGTWGPEDTRFYSLPRALDAAHSYAHGRQHTGFRRWAGFRLGLWRRGQPDRAWLMKAIEKLLVERAYPSASTDDQVRSGLSGPVDPEWNPDRAVETQPGVFLQDDRSKRHHS